LVAAGLSVEDLQLLMGHSKLDHLEPYLEVNQDTLREMFSGVLSVADEDNG
jgi:site-specific recombinase XerD